jgi:hypothetical protein
VHHTLHRQEAGLIFRQTFSAAKGYPSEFRLYRPHGCWASKCFFAGSNDSSKTGIAVRTLIAGRCRWAYRQGDFAGTSALQNSKREIQEERWSQTATRTESQDRRLPQVQRASRAMQSRIDQYLSSSRMIEHPAMYLRVEASCALNGDYGKFPARRSSTSYRNPDFAGGTKPASDS